MGNDTNQQSGGAQGAGGADLRTQLRTALIEEFQRALSLMAALTEDQRKALNKLVADDDVTSQSILKALNPGRLEVTFSQAKDFADGLKALVRRSKDNDLIKSVSG